MTRPPNILLWTGEKHSGKTTAATALVRSLRAAGRAVTGLLAPVAFEHARRVGYDAIDVRSDLRRPLLRLAADPARREIGPFAFVEAGRQLGAAALADPPAGTALVVLDEFGPLELRGGGWRDAADRLAAGAVPLLLVVRRELVASLADLYGANAPEAVRAADPDATQRVITMLTC